MTKISLHEIQAPIANEIAVFESKFKEFMKSNVPLLDTIMNFIVKRKGKQMRPILVFLSAGLSGKITEATYRGAALIELLHTATLVHDDVVDNSYYRRGFFSINALWKNKIAVLVGDYLLSRGLLLSIEHRDFELLKIVSNAVREMSEGELLQMEKSRLLDITEDIYYTIIRQKTAVLLRACCAVGAHSAGADENITLRMAQFGEKLGVAFQIKDDLFDYGTAEIGKPVGIDIKEKKITLPLIYALQRASWAERKQIIFMIKNQSENPKKVAEIIDFVKRSGGIEYAQQAMENYRKQALEILCQFPRNDFKNALEKFLSFVIDRKF
ncbi:MAG: polyprenyl synthetase family protein [Cytophagales bacterium]|nr:polyprenyl synthetase family protein [Cytophagales bacterium]MDW8383661.1 polyprenyl synthetase family protein [Flammeovirgaceae bacterium]